MPFPALLLILAALLPLASCLVLGAIGRRLGSPLAGYVATFFIAASFLCSGWGMLRWAGGGNYHGQPYGKLGVAINLTFPLVPIGTAGGPHGFEQDHPGWLDCSIYLDSLTFSLFVTVTLSALLVHLFSIRSLRRDPRLARFFTCLSLLCFATLAVILSGGLLQAIVFLELAGVAAALLIGFRGNDEPAGRAAGRLFVVNRIADAGLLLGTGILFAYVGNLSFPELWLLLGNAASGAAAVLPDGSIFPTGMLTVAGVAIFFGAAARCAQFPLHVWAGDVADGVATAAATVFGFSVAIAGLYLIARLFPLFTPSARLLIAIVGVTTLVMASLIAAVQPDVKRALAFAAAAQFGLMVLGIGVGSWVGAMFHLVGGIFIQVLLFLAAGAVIRGARGETQLSQYGGLFARMPVTALAAGVGALAVCGVGWHGVGLSGYFSRGLILRHVAAYAALALNAHRSRAYEAIFFFPIFATMVIGFGMSRWWMLVFAGPPRDRRLHDHAREAPAMLWPLVVLAIMTALAGQWLGIREMLESSIIESRQTVQIQAEASTSRRSTASRTFEEVWPGGELGDEDESHTDAAASALTSAAQVEGAERTSRWIWPATAIGMLAALLLYFRGNGLAARLARIPPLNWLHAWLLNRMFFDELYQSLFVVPVISVARGIAWLDVHVIERLSQFPARVAVRHRPAEATTDERSPVIDPEIRRT